MDSKRENYNMRIAVPISDNSVSEALKSMDRAYEKGADIIELRIDNIFSETKRPNLKRLVNHNSLPKIVTNRHRDEGGGFTGSEERRINLLNYAVGLGVEYIDIEGSFYTPLLGKNTIKEGTETKFIISYHNFNETPEDLDRVYENISEKEPDIVKIATKANSHHDSLRMLNLISNADRDIIGICMGREGIMTRVYGPAFGGYLTFASLETGKESAKGQMDIDTLRETWKKLGLT